jgi:radical SAM superfamily enzyme YgiQ (UPF0313 family)
MKSFGAVSEPLGLAYLAAALETVGCPVEIMDAAALDLTPDDIIQRIHAGDFGLVGVTLLTPMFDAVQRLLRRIRTSKGEAKLLVGGPHASALPVRTMEEIPEIDLLCVGEGEATIVDLVHRLSAKGPLSDIPGLVWRQGHRIVRNGDRPFLKDLDALPKPARHLLPMERYQLTASRTRGSGFCPTVILARGCPFDCRYCSHPFGRTFRHHSVGRVIEELSELKKQYHVTQVNLEADTLTLDSHFVQQLCRRLIDENLNLQWTCESRVDTVDEPTLRLMKAAGCWQISYGVESGSQRLLDHICKGVTREKIIETFSATQKTGISIRGFFMLGLPHETEAETLKTIRFARQLDPLWAQFTITIPYPGTPMFDELNRMGMIRHYHWANYNTWGGWADRRLPYVPSGRSEADIKAMQKRAMRMFYLRPKIFLRFIRSISSPSDFAKYFSGFWVLFKTGISNSVRKPPAPI